MAGLRRDCNLKEKKDRDQRSRKANHPNMTEEREAYKETKRVLKVGIRMSKSETGKGS